MQRIALRRRLLNQIAVTQGKRIAVGHNGGLLPLTPGQRIHKLLGSAPLTLHQQHIARAGDFIKAEFSKHPVILGLRKKEQTPLPLRKGGGAQSGDHGGGQPFSTIRLIHRNALEHIFLKPAGGGDLALAIIKNGGKLDALVIAQPLFVQKFLQLAANLAGRRLGIQLL